jgi:hypothetical protein
MNNDRVINCVRDPVTTIKKFTIYGERHSGTKLLQNAIALNFEANFTDEYGHKHFIGFCDIGGLASSHDTIFICIIRNPYDWILANNRQPHHSPIIRPNFLYLKDWFSVDSNEKEILIDRCYWDNVRYKDIYELRYLKTLYLLYILPILVHNYVFIRYEDFISDQMYYYNYISNMFDMKMRPRFPETARLLEINPPNNYSISQNDLEHVNKNIYWNIEKQCGYNKKDSYP